MLSNATNPWQQQYVPIYSSSSSLHLSQPAGMPQHTTLGPPLLMKSHICLTNDHLHKVIPALTRENSLPRNGTVFLISLPTHTSGSSVLACLSPPFSDSVTPAILKFVFLVLALPPSAGYRATQTTCPLDFQMLLLLPQTSLSTLLSHFCSIFQGGLENSEGALKNAFFMVPT